MKPSIILRASDDAEKSIFVDFDGVLATYDGNYQKNKFGEPIYEMIDLLNDLSSKGIKITVWTARSADEKEALEEWLKENNVPCDELITNKPKFDVLVDDRVLTFNGDVTDIASQVGDFEPYWKTASLVPLEVGPGHAIATTLHAEIVTPGYLNVKDLDILKCKGKAVYEPPDPSVGWNSASVSLDLEVLFKVVLEHVSSWRDYFGAHFDEEEFTEENLRSVTRELILGEDLSDSVLLAVLKECLPKNDWDLSDVSRYPHEDFPYRLEITQLDLSEDNKFLTLVVKMEIHEESTRLADYLDPSAESATLQEWSWDAPNDWGYLEEVLASLPLSEDIPVKSKAPIPQDGVFSPSEAPVETLKRKEKEKNIDVEQFDTGFPSNTYKRS